MDDFSHTKDLYFATIEFYKTYVVCKMNEGIVLDIPKALALHEQSRSFYNGLKYGFIFDRTIDYTIDPIVYIQCPYYADINAMFIVAEKNATKQIVQFEQNFSKYKLTVFNTLEEAQKEIKKVKFGEKSPLTEEPLG
ncbi:hypothetical protein JM84_0619 [Dokdonia sp. Hel_I_63]|uniref:hypothetical protein n=1 Tax=unclassified Dokdonia TaxID=2615033 RepID=UPI00020A69F7|nr:MULTISPECIES: hypothetical protein [unclassified Dokdonia]AEE19027.1 hypothetical protein Krodi_1043 [Dokdonia sp. 4H-3-7-5]TVZ21741.1 hypothetical protein JM84_0619 [Dokdonia sp. Hel_I_63]